MNALHGVRAYFSMPARLWEEIRSTGGAFVVLTVIGYAAGMLRPGAIEPLLRLFSEAVADAGMVEIGGAALMWALFMNNLIALLTALCIGIVPFVRLPALELGLNALLLGGMAAYYQQNGIGMAAFLAGTLPHGVTELAALVCACAAGLYLCRAVTGRLLGREDAPSVRQTMGDCLRVYARVAVPLLFVSAAIESFITPMLLARFL